MKIRSVHAKRFSIFSKRTNARGRARGNRRIVTKHSVSLDNPLPASPRIRETGLSVISRSESVQRCLKNPSAQLFLYLCPRQVSRDDRLFRFSWLGDERTIKQLGWLLLRFARLSAAHGLSNNSRTGAKRRRWSRVTDSMERIDFAA